MASSPRILLALMIGSLGVPLSAQIDDVPIYEDSFGDEPSAEVAALSAAVAKLHAEKRLTDRATFEAGLDRREFAIALPPPRTTELRGTAVWRLARASYVRVGHYFRCKDCEDWHLELSGGMVVGADGIVATSRHVVVPDDDSMAESWLVCADDAGRVYPVTELLASDPVTDIAILRTGATSLPPLPLRTTVQPGERVYVFSDPGGSRGVFTSGILNRFARARVEGTDRRRVTMDVSVEWAPGSSGAAILDEFGNAIGQVNAISTHDEIIEPDDPDAPLRPVTYMVMHHAARAADVLALLPPPKRAGDATRQR
ncbi:MAG: serine protease [Planctomycetota bacterium]